MYSNFNKGLGTNNKMNYINQDKSGSNMANPNILHTTNLKLKDEQGSYLEGISKGNHGSNGSDCGSPLVHRRANVQHQQVYHIDKTQKVHLGQSPTKKLNQNESAYVIKEQYNDGIMRSGSQKQNKNIGGKVINEFVLRNDIQPQKTEKHQNNNIHIHRQTLPNDKNFNNPQPYIQK